MLKELIYPSTFAALTIYGNSIVVGRRLENISRKIGLLELKLDDLKKEMDDVAKKMDLLAFRQHELGNRIKRLTRLIDCSKPQDDNRRRIHRE